MSQRLQYQKRERVEGSVGVLCIPIVCLSIPSSVHNIRNALRSVHPHPSQKETVWRMPVLTDSSQALLDLESVRRWLMERFSQSKGDLVVYGSIGGQYLSFAGCTAAARANAAE